MTGCSYDSHTTEPCPKPATMAVITRQRHKPAGKGVWVEAHADVESAPTLADPFCNGHGLMVVLGVLAALGVADR